MFETRLHRISADHAIDRRKLWEGFLQWANRLSRLDSDNIARLQFGPDKFELDSFIEMSKAGFDVGGDVGVVSSEAGAVVVASKKVHSLDISGDYWIDWSLGLKVKSGQCRFVGGIPFIGNEFVGSAQDFKAVIGWLQNSSDSKAETDGEGSDLLSSAFEEDMSLVSDDVRYGRAGERMTVPPFSSRDRYVPTDFFGLGVGSAYYHLSGSGAASTGRVTGSVGVLVFCQDESELSIESAHLSLRRRVR